MSQENILVNYLYKKTYNNTPLNVIGATTDTSLRTVDTISGDTAYVRKFGVDYLIKDVTSLEDPVDVNLTVRAYAEDGTLLGSRVGGGAYVDGSSVATSQGIYIKFSASGGAVTLNTFGPVYSIHTDVDGAGRAFDIPQDVIADGDDLYFCLSKTGSSYYMSSVTDFSMKYGGDRHTPALGNIDKPYFDIATAYAALNSANDGVVVLDSETYDEELDLDRATTFLLALSGQTPTITRGVGARVTREVSTQYNNLTACYFNENGLDVNAGDWQNPKLTIANAITNRGGKHVVYGGTGATVNGGIFESEVTINAAFTLESDYGYFPTLTNPEYSNIVTISNVNGNINGFNVYNSKYAGISCAIAFVGTIENCTCTYNSSFGIYLNNASAGTVKNCLCYVTYRGIYVNRIPDLSITIENCICYSCMYGIDIYIDSGKFLGTIKNCLCYNCTSRGINLIIQTELNGLIENNICFNTSYGLHMQVGTFTGTIRNNIFYHNITFDLFRNGGVAITITESNYGTNSGFTIGAGCITTDPKFCKTVNPCKLGISADSGAYRTDTLSDDMGAHFRIIEINNDDIIINGFNINGQNQINNAIFIADTADHTGIKIKWCSMYDFQGIAIDPYDDDANTNWQILNCKIYNNGNGIKFSYGGNTVQECLIFNNTIFGIHADYTGQTFNHNVFYLNQYNLYLESNSGSITYKNNISDNASLYGIYSEVALIVTYSNITDAVNANVDVTDSSNIANNPLFIDVDNYDFNIKTIEAGYKFDSGCKDTADDGYDIGAYKLSRSVADSYWQKYQFPTNYNPGKVTFQIKILSLNKLRTAQGKLKKWAIDSKRIYTLKWDTKQASTEELRNKLEYFLQLMQMRTNDNSDGDDLLRLTFRPTGFIDSGTGAVTDATAKTVTDSGKSWTENKHKGFWVALKWDDDTGNGTINAAGKTLTIAPSPGWTINEWVGYYFPYNGYYYYIISNTAAVLTFSDPDGTLSNTANIDWNIVKYFKILSNSKTILTLEDDDSELSSTPTKYYIDFIEVKVTSDKLTANQKRYYYEKETWKTGYSLIMEEF